MITDQREFDELLERCRDEKLVAFDTEFIRERRYRPRLCLIQIGLEGEAFAVDPFEVQDLRGLHSLLADESVCKIVHAGQQDMEIFFSDSNSFDESGGAPRGIFDTQIAAALLGYGDSVGYSRLVGEILSVRLSKAETFTDWARRPLADRQIRYALDDVVHLHPIYSKLTADLESRGRMDWLAEELQVYTDPTFYRPDPTKLYRRVKGAAKLGRRELAVLRALAMWREEEASDRDRPRNHIISDDILVELVKAKPTKASSLRSFRGVHPQLARRSGDLIVQRIREALDTPDDELPTLLEKSMKDSSVGLVVDLLETFLKARAAQVRVSPAYLATRSELHALVRQKRADRVDDSELRVLGGWRHELVGQDLVGLLDGRYSLAIEPDTGEVVVQSQRR